MPNGLYLSSVMFYQSFDKHIIICLLLLISVLRLEAQNIQFTHYGIEEGLPSPETYFAHQDASGYMWFGTDRGLSRYDG